MRGTAESAAGPSDADLVRAARGGDAGAFRALFLRYQDRVYRMAHRMIGDREEATDLAQEVFLTVHRSLDRFEERSRFSTWLYRVTVNRCRDELRKRASVKHTRPGPLDPGLPVPVAGAGPADAASSRETARIVQEALLALPEESREICILRDIEGLSYEEIAAALDLPVGTVRSRLFRARAALRDLLEPRLPEGA